MRFSILKSLCVLSLIGIVACNKKDDFLGKEIISVPADFKLDKFEFSKVSADFTKDTVSLVSKFSSRVTAIVKLVGLESGAVKEILINTDKFDPSVFTWRGGHDDIYFFKKNEKVVATLSFFGTDKVYKDTITIANVQTFKTSTTIPLNNLDFETVPEYPDWIPYSDVMIIRNMRVDTLRKDANDPNAKMVQGNRAYRWKGKKNGTGYMGGADAGDGTLPARPFYPLPADPSQIYFNVFVFGFGNKDATLAVEFKESDNPDNLSKGGRDDGYQYSFTDLSHVGWKMFSVKLSDVPVASYCLAGKEGGGCGNKKKETNRIKFVAFSIETKTANAPITVYIDFPIFTIGGPFDPSKF